MEQNSILCRTVDAYYDLRLLRERWRLQRQHATAWKDEQKKPWPDSKFDTLMVPDPQLATHEQLHNDSADSLVPQMPTLRSKVLRESVYELGAVQTIFFQTSHIRPAGRLLREGTVSNGLRLENRPAQAGVKRLHGDTFGLASRT